LQAPGVKKGERKEEAAPTTPPSRHPQSPADFPDTLIDEDFRGGECGYYRAMATQQICMFFEFSLPRGGDHLMSFLCRSHSRLQRVEMCFLTVQSSQQHTLCRYNVPNLTSTPRPSIKDRKSSGNGGKDGGIPTIGGETSGNAVQDGGGGKDGGIPTTVGGEARGNGIQDGGNTGGKSSGSGGNAITGDTKDRIKSSAQTQHTQSEILLWHSGNP
jgi:hypothetical protein